MGTDCQACFWLTKRTWNEWWTNKRRDLNLFRFSSLFFLCVRAAGPLCTRLSFFTPLVVESHSLSPCFSFRHTSSTRFAKQIRIVSTSRASVSLSHRFLLLCLTVLQGIQSLANQETSHRNLATISVVCIYEVVSFPRNYSLFLYPTSIKTASESTICSAISYVFSVTFSLSMCFYFILSNDRYTPDLQIVSPFWWREFYLLLIYIFWGYRELFCLTFQRRLTFTIA